MPETFTEPAPIANVPENDTTAAPVAGGHGNCVEPTGRERVGGVAVSPVVGWLQATTWTSESVIALAPPVAAFNVNDAVDAATAQLFVPR